MNKFETRVDLIKYIKAMLGEPTICVELSDEQINYIIDDLLEYFKKEISEGEEIDFINWFKFRRACVAYCGELWARSLCKYKLQLTDNGTINAEFLHSIFQEKIYRLEHKND